MISGIQDCLNIPIKKSNIHYIVRLKRKTHMNNLIDAKQPHFKIQYPFIVKTPNKLGIEEILLSLIKGIYVKPISNAILNGKKKKKN